MSDKGMTRSADETAAAFANLAAQSGMNFAQETASDYISRKAAIAKIRAEGVYGSGYSNEEREDDVVDMITSIPAADVRPVVLCRDCKRYGGRPWENNETGICSRTDCGVGEDDFCSYGEKQEKR